MDIFKSSKGQNYVKFVYLATFCQFYQQQLDNSLNKIYVYSFLGLMIKHIKDNVICKKSGLVHCYNILFIITSYWSAQCIAP